VAPAQPAWILEEAPEEGFEEMQAGRISIDSYLESLDIEYPDFSRAMCRMLRGFYGSGKKIYQIEPFMENLIEIHLRYPLWRELKNRLPASYQLKVTFLMADAVRQMNYGGHLYGPGDILTLLYRFHPHKRLPSEDILAARALIYVKLILKDEIPPVKEQYPHTRDEIEVAEITKQLSYGDCRHLYPLILHSPIAEARQNVQNYLKKHRHR
jgi:hypothetical protein